MLRHTHIHKSHTDKLADNEKDNKAQRLNTQHEVTLKGHKYGDKQMLSLTVNFMHH